MAELIVSEKHRFIFCAIPKVATTQFKQLFLRLNGDTNWAKGDPHFHKLHDRDIYLKMMMHPHSSGSVAQLLKDPTYFKAVFFRDPLTRLLSAYLSKFHSDNRSQSLSWRSREAHRAPEPGTTVSNRCLS